MMDIDFSSSPPFIYIYYIILRENSITGNTRVRGPETPKKRAADVMMNEWYVIKRRKWAYDTQKRQMG